MSSSKRALVSAVGVGERAPVQAGLYDDLPPPDDWEEEQVPHLQVGLMYYIYLLLISPHLTHP